MIPVVERYLWCIVPIGLMALGVVMIVRPAAIAVMNRDEGEDSAPVDASELWKTRILGIVLLAAGIFVLVLILSGARGADGV